MTGTRVMPSDKGRVSVIVAANGAMFRSPSEPSDIPSLTSVYLNLWSLLVRTESNDLFWDTQPEGIGAPFGEPVGISVQLGVPTFQLKKKCLPWALGGWSNSSTKTPKLPLLAEPTS